MIKGNQGSRATLNECIKLIAQGDLDALRHVYDQLKDEIFAYSLVMVRNHEDAKDIMQDTFIKVRASAKNYKPGSNPKAWIFTIARNLAYDILRKRKRVVSLKDQLSNEHYTFESQLDDNSELFDLLSILNSDEQNIVYLRIYGGLSHIEISKVLSVSYEKVRWKYSYAIKKLKKHLLKNSENIIERECHNEN